MKTNSSEVVFTPSGKSIHSPQALDPEHLVNKDLTFSLLVLMQHYKPPI
jgi:hypothetical protein